MKVPPFTLVQLHYFAAAVECGSMTAASRELMVSQSAVSTAIAQLEKALGVTLVLRHHVHGLALTGAGRAFHAELRAFLAHSQELADTAANAGQALVGDLTVGCFATLAPFRLPRILASLREAHPAARCRARPGQGDPGHPQGRSIHAAMRRDVRDDRSSLDQMTYANFLRWTDAPGSRRVNTA